MIWQPRPGQCVRLHYRWRTMPLHGRTGVVVCFGRGPGPRNVGVEVDGSLYVVPRGNLQTEKIDAK